MKDTKLFNIEVGTGIIQMFQRMETNTLQIFSEFIDNSYQSFIDHKKELEEVNVKYCDIKINWSNDEFSITDNCYGMGEEQYSRALRLNAPASEYSENSLGKYGIGLKYAAASLGDFYNIESTELNSTVIYSTDVDIDYIKANNPKEIIANKLITTKDTHYTKITVKKMIKSYSYKEAEKVINLLGKKFESFISKNLLKICINNINVEYHEPEYRVKTDGSPYFDFFKNSFTFNGKVYEYAGFIGILKKGNQDETGFSLRVNDRVLQMGYKPKDLLGRGNDYKQQRIFGTIDLYGDSWVPRFDKDGIVWSDTGLEEEFIQSLKRIKCFSDMLKTAVTLRKEDDPFCKVTTNLKNAHITHIKNNYKNGEKVCFSVYPNEGYYISKVKINDKEIEPEKDRLNSYSFICDNTLMKIVVNTKEIKKDPGDIIDHSTIVLTPPTIAVDKTQNYNIIDKRIITEKIDLKQRLEGFFKYLSAYDFIDYDDNNENDVNPDGVIIKFRNTSYSFLINLLDEPNKKYIDIIKKEPYKNSFVINLNYYQFSSNHIIINENSLILLSIQAIVLTLSRFQACRSGCELSMSTLMINAINKIMN